MLGAGRCSRKAVASVRSAARDFASESVDSSTISDDGRAGSPNCRLTSIVPGGARRQGSIEAARPAATASATAKEPQPRKISSQAMPASSSARVPRLRKRQEGEEAIEEDPPTYHSGRVRGGGEAQRLARPIDEVRRGEPAEMLRRQDLAVPPVIRPVDDRGVDLAAVERIQQIAGVVEPHFDRERRVVRAQSCQQGRHFRAADMGGNAQRETPADGGQPRHGAVVGREELARGFEEDGALRGKAHQPRRALDQLPADLIFQPFQLHADGALGGAEHVGRAREAAQVGDGHECLDGIDVERGHPIHPDLLSLKYETIQF